MRGDSSRLKYVKRILKKKNLKDKKASEYHSGRANLLAPVPKEKARHGLRGGRFLISGAEKIVAKRTRSATSTGASEKEI